MLPVILFFYAQFAHAAASFPYPNFLYQPMDPDAVLFFGAPNPENKATIRLISSNNFNLVTWAVPEQDSENPILHPIQKKNQAGHNFVTCLFFTPNNSTMITDYYLDQMSKSIKSARIVLLAPTSSLEPENDGFFQLMEWYSRVFPNTTKSLPSTMLFFTGDNGMGPNKISEIMSNYTKQFNDSRKIKVIATGLVSRRKIGTSWNIPSAIKTLRGLPSIPLLPTDVTLSSELNTTIVDDVSYFYFK